jgi:hypothetical protein
MVQLIFKASGPSWTVRHIKAQKPHLEIGLQECGSGFRAAGQFWIGTSGMPRSRGFQGSSQNEIARFENAIAASGSFCAQARYAIMFPEDVTSASMENKGEIENLGHLHFDLARRAIPPT